MSHRIARYLAVSALILGLAFALVWVLVTDGGGAEPAPAHDRSTEAVARTEPSPSERATRKAQRPQPSEDAANGKDAKREARLAQLRKTDAYEAFAEYDRASRARDAKVAVELFAPRLDGEVDYRWANERALWNAIAPDVRDSCLLAGPEANRRLWNTDKLVPAGVEMTWHNRTTQGRGQFLELDCLVRGKRGLERRFYGFLINTNGRTGTVADRMPPVVVRESDVPTYQASTRIFLHEAWRWVRSKPVISDKKP